MKGLREIMAECEASRPRLTPRQTAVLCGLAGSMTTKQIAGELHLSPKTVEWHRARLERAIGVNDVAAFTRYALAHGLVENEFVGE